MFHEPQALQNVSETNVYSIHEYILFIKRTPLRAQGTTKITFLWKLFFRFYVKVTAQVESPRTQVARAACNTLATILKNTNYTKKPVCDTHVQQIKVTCFLKNCLDDKPVMFFFQIQLSKSPISRRMIDYRTLDVFSLLTL